MRWTSLAIALLMILSALPAVAQDDGVGLHLPMEGKARRILDASGKPVGLHHPAAIADQDDPASTDPSRYRVEGAKDKGIRYFADDQSYSHIDKGPAFDKPVEALAVSLRIRTGDAQKNRFASIVSNTYEQSPVKGAAELFCGMIQPPIRDHRRGRPTIRYPDGPIQEGGIAG